MSQQLAIIVMVDIDSAIKANTLNDNVYLFDNMKLQGSEGEGTPKLVTAINGTHWIDGSQANEQVLNWLPYGIGSIPPTVPSTFFNDRAQDSDRQALLELARLAKRLEGGEKAADKAALATGGTEKAGAEKAPSLKSIAEELLHISKKAGLTVAAKQMRVASEGGGNGSPGSQLLPRLMDVTGKFIQFDSAESVPEISSFTPIITDITGEAVDKKIIYPAVYGSPDLVTDGWYWSASVDSGKPGTYSYTMHIQLYRLVYTNQAWVWEPIHMQCEAWIRISSSPKVNGFTGAGMGLLPIV